MTDLPRDIVLKPLLYRHVSRHVPVETLIRLAHKDGKAVFKGSNTYVYGLHYWEPFGWIVLVGSREPSVAEEGSSKTK